jgi:spore germination protein YaaH
MKDTKAATLEVLGYYPIDYPGDKVSYQSLEAHHPHIDSVAVFNYYLDAGGHLSGEPDRALMEFARPNHVEVLALIHNMRGGSFDRWAAHTVLTEPTARARAVENVLGLVSGQDYSGVNVDLENVAPADAAGYTAFIKDLAHRLRPEGFLVSASVPAKVSDDPSHGWSGAFDYAGIGKYAEEVMIMTYDEHWPGGKAGPVASIDWVERVIKYAVSRIPRKKILMGVAAYGYDWPAWGQGRALPAAKALSHASARGVAIGWDEQAKVPTYTYHDGSSQRVVYFENARSTAVKIDLAKGYGLRGIAIWRLGHEDPGIWRVIAERRGK